MTEAAPQLSHEADQAFTMLPPILGMVYKCQGTTATGSTAIDLSASTALGGTGASAAVCERYLYEFWADADVVWAVSGVNNGSVTTGGTVADGHSGSTAKAYERLPFFLRSGEHYLYLVTSSGMANVEIRPAGDISLASSKGRL